VNATPAATTTDAPLALREIGTGRWLLAPDGDLGGETVAALRRSCVAVLDRGGLELVVDLRGVRVVCTDALEVLGLVADTLDARSGALSLRVSDDGPLAAAQLPPPLAAASRAEPAGEGGESDA
jgi:anti-anti-sigma regulatory factor